MIDERISKIDKDDNTRDQLLAGSDGNAPEGNEGQTIAGRMTSPEAQQAMQDLQKSMIQDFTAMQGQAGVIRGMADWAYKKVMDDFITDDSDNDLSVIVLGLSAAALDGLKTVATVQTQGEIDYAGFKAKKWWKSVFTESSSFGTAATVSLVTGAAMMPFTTGAAVGAVGAIAASRGWQGAQFLGQGLSNMASSTYSNLQALAGAVTGG
jgi:hypothetical protein